MREKRIRNYEVKCLLELLSTIINGEETPKWKRQPQWGELYKLADYHGVANMVYYSVLGSEEAAVAPWKPKFEERYHQAVQADGRYSKAIPELLEELELERIHCLALIECRMGHYYNQSDMRALKKVRFLAEKGKESKLRAIMKVLGYEEKESRVEGEWLFYRIPGVQVILQTEFSFTNKRMAKYFSVPIRLYEREKDKRYIHTFLAEDFYVHVIGRAAESYARGNLSIRDVIDIWLYYTKVYKLLDWEQITKEIEFLKLDKFHLYLIRLAAYWFGGMLFPESDSIFEAMEKYILSKGIQGRRISATLLPLVKEVADFYQKDLKKKRREQRRTWVFPKREYMETMFPLLVKLKWLLPACWFRRLVRLGAQQGLLLLRRRLAVIGKGLAAIGKGLAGLWNHICKLVERIRSFLQPYKESITNFTDMRVENAKRRLRHIRQKGFAAIEGIQGLLHSGVRILKRILNIHS